MRWIALRTACWLAVLWMMRWCARSASRARGHGSTSTSDATSRPAKVGTSTTWTATGGCGSPDTAPDGATGAVPFSTHGPTVDPRIRARCAALSRRAVRDVSLAESLEQFAQSMLGEGRDDLAADLLAAAGGLREPWGQWFS